LERAGRHFNGWFPTGPDAKRWGEQWRQVQAVARDAGRKPDDVVPAIYLTVAVDDDAAKASQRIDEFLQAYYGRRPDLLKQHQACFSGSASAAAEWINGYVEQGARHIVLRFAGDHERHQDVFARVRESLRA
jgi:alkanesulfonate monooxygenase SsuD/methylene tetrahydromethanopterin reductase-like flavin-dependent oxidoreductase (luciferase family)